MRRLFQRHGVLLALVVLSGVVAVSPRLWARPAAAPAAPGAAAVLTVSVSRCGQGWSQPRPGPQTLQLHNSGAVAAEAQLIEPASGGVLGEVDGIAPGTTRSLPVTLGGGTFALRCLPEDRQPVLGPAVHVPGPRGGSGPAVQAVTENDLAGPLRQYQAYVAAGLAQLAGETGALLTAVRTGDVGAARAAWLPAHLTYERLGAAYGTFGDLGDAIDGRPDGLPGGVADPDFTGFHRLEYGLWHDLPQPALADAAADLDGHVHELQDAFPTMRLDPNDLGLRAHEIMEDALQFELTGTADQGSGTSLATADANLQGTRAVVGVLRPLLASRYSGLAGVDAALDRTQAALAAAQTPGGGWTPPAALPPLDRERLNGAAGDLLERLAPIATICEVRR